MVQILLVLCLKCFIDVCCCWGLIMKVHDFGALFCFFGLRVHNLFIFHLLVELVLDLE